MFPFVSINPKTNLEILVLIVIILVVVLVIVLILVVILIVVLAVLAVLVVTGIVSVVESVIVVVLIVVRHFKFLLLVISYRSSMSKSHKNYTYFLMVLWYYFLLIFYDLSTIINFVNRYPLHQFYLHPYILIIYTPLFMSHRFHGGSYLLIALPCHNCGSIPRGTSIQPIPKQFHQKHHYENRQQKGCQKGNHRQHYAHNHHNH